jgi:hypothetical protein
MSERLNGDPREIKFGGEGKAESINRGFAFTTLRNPKTDYNFSRGKRVLANCFDDNEKVPVVVITNVIKRLSTFSIPQLALDGFFSVPMVIDGMKTYPGYEKINGNSPMQAITFIKEESFKAVPTNQRDGLLYYNFDELVKIPELRYLFFPTMAFHLSDYGGVKDWIDWLGGNKLITKEEKKRMESTKIRDTNITHFFEGRREAFKKLTIDPSSFAFNHVILGLPFYKS